MDDSVVSEGGPFLGPTEAGLGGVSSLRGGETRVSHSWHRGKTTSKSGGAYRHIRREISLQLALKCKLVLRT